ncbi:MAG: hypothetical protein M4579_006046 [Chaenotheca gracillima]|nr:MAG: hypothetical protein M4579_006046 [Chaenotheca gracillima]
MAAAAVMMPADAPAPPADAAVEVPPTLTPPPSTGKLPPLEDMSSSELSDLEDDEDIGDIEPDHYYEGGKVPVFKPTMDQFRSFKKFVNKIDKYGMKSGIVKVIPPPEWRDSLPPLDHSVKSIKVKNPITQEIAGSQGTYRQANIEKQRSYNLPQWRQLSEASDHQPPARRGERRPGQEKSTRSTAKSTGSGGGRKVAGRSKKAAKPESTDTAVGESNGTAVEPKIEGPPTPTSPNSPKVSVAKTEETNSEAQIKDEPNEDELEDASPSKGKGRQPKSVSARRKYNRRAAADVIDEAAFEGFDYRISNPEDYTPERCEELERHYWKTLTYNSPLYGADMPGSLFDDSTTSWNVAKLENLLDVLGQKVPGVNTAYLYLGMWKSTFAWHLEDVDLYSINYIHFGAPKQWYSISQEDARRFEAAMKSVWPNDAKQCSQFLRHKTYLISPSLLQSQFNIRVNRLVHHEGEFVITFPYGYHSGYNLGYNCAESVNFATESWLDYGRVAKKCDCEADSVWIDVNDIERRLRGEETDYEETEDEQEDEEDDETGRIPSDLPTPPESVEGKPKPRPRKRKRDTEEGAAKSNVKKIRVRIKAPTKEPCVLCPNDIPSEQLLPTDAGNTAHRLCALYTPETYIEGATGSEKICNVANIDKARLDLKCNFCRSKRGACFQCSQKKCTRAYHPTCAAAAGVLVDMRDVPVFGEDGTEYTDVGIDFRCRFHRPKRAKQLDGDVLEQSELIQKFALQLRVGDVVQMQYHKGDIFAGNVVENRCSEQTIVVDILPKGDRVEVEYKWLLVLDPSDSRLPVPSATARPISEFPAQKKNLAKEKQPTHPIPDDPFCDPDGPHVWSEFHTAQDIKNPHQVKVDMDKVKGVWHYLGKTSTEARAQYTEDARKSLHNPESNFLESVKPPPVINASAQRKPIPVPHPPVNATRPNQHALNAIQAQARQPEQPPADPYQPARTEKPYQYKPKSAESYRIDPQSLLSQQAFQQQAFGRSYGSSAVVSPLQPSNGGPANSPSPYNASSRTGFPERSPSAQHQAPVAHMSSAMPTSVPSGPEQKEGYQLGQAKPELGRTPQAPKPEVHHSAISAPHLSNSSPNTKTSAGHPISAQVSIAEPIQSFPYLARSHAKAPITSTYQSPYSSRPAPSEAYLPHPSPSGTAVPPARQAQPQAHGPGYNTYEAFFEGMKNLTPAPSMSPTAASLPSKAMDKVHVQP